MKRKTLEDFKNELSNKYNKEYTVLSNKYINTHTKLKFKHNICNKEFSMTPANILHGQQCPYCKKDRLRIKNGINQKEFEEKIKQKYGNEYTVLGTYVNANTKIKIRHNCCKCNNYEYMVLPSKLYNLDRRCPVCTGKKIIKGINDISTTHPHLIKYFAEIDDAYKYSYGSEHKVKVKCPNCGYIKSMRIVDISRNRFSCPKCGDGKSYPEKFMFNIMDQLGIKFKTEYSPTWIKPKRYDFYIPSLNCIIETHGEQHYTKGFESLGGRTLMEEQRNDKYKKETALNNGIKHYIIIDCRKSELKWIKNSILKSELANLFDLSKINWKSCAEFANKNIAKEVCETFKTIKDLKQISIQYHISTNTVRNYLYKAI